ncbi:MAG TPA: hypothetical protein VNZ53_51685 [Steroidobacteraceae bacterium]|jgi:DHA2 family multidrug resistance protein|nr:hypothetical protein [Steroidobacteraceae bacterium]
MAPARALGTLVALVQRESNVLAYIDGFWILGLMVASLMTCAPQGPFTPEPFGVAKAFLRKCGASVR